MQEQLVVVITGAGRGLGHSLAEAYLAKDNCTVIGTIRDHASPGVAALQAATKGTNSVLHLVKVESSSATDAADAIAEVRARCGISHIDVLIANAGTSPPVAPLETVGLDELKDTLAVNALGPLALYQACYSLLRESRHARFITISSAAGSLGGMQSNGAHIAPAYSISKAVLNWITLSAHCGNDWLIAAAINPGLVATDMGNKTAHYLGLEKAPITKAQSTEKIINLIDGASRETISGKFLNAMDGRELPW